MCEGISNLYGGCRTMKRPTVKDIAKKNKGVDPKQMRDINKVVRELNEQGFAAKRQHLGHPFSQGLAPVPPEARARPGE